MPLLFAKTHSVEERLRAVSEELRREPNGVRRLAVTTDDAQSDGLKTVRHSTDGVVPFGP